MPYFFIAMIIGVVLFLIVKAFKKKSLPNNQYTPHDDIELGRPFDSKREEPTHEVQYEQRPEDENDKPH